MSWLANNPTFFPSFSNLFPTLSQPFSGLLIFIRRMDLFMLQTATFVKGQPLLG
jgi:hypothetical protein